MPTLEESRRRVKETVQDEVDHEGILADLQDEIDRHNAIKDDLRDNISGSSRRERSNGAAGVGPRERSTKFRFKSGKKDPREDRKRRHRSRRISDEPERGHRTHHKRRKHGEEYPTPPNDRADEEASHPFPREPADPDTTETDAFRASLFDALADDEGAAAYWESVYSQPIHVYQRPTVKDERTGKLEQMSDEEYVSYVKEKMWERKNPEIVQDRQRKEKERKREEEEKTRRREEFVRRKERAAWERAQRWSGGDDDEDNKHREGYEYAFAGEANTASSRGDDPLGSDYANAWIAYLTSWKSLLTSATPTNPSASIPWPVLPGKAVIRPNIEAFMRRAPGNVDANREDNRKALKAERVRWHPDKVQQRFGGKVDAGTMKLVTGVFQIADGIIKELENGKGG